MVRLSSLLAFVFVGSLISASPLLEIPEVVAVTDDLSPVHSASTPEVVAVKDDLSTVHSASTPETADSHLHLEERKELDHQPTSTFPEHLDHLPETVYASDMTPARLSLLEALQRETKASGMTNAQRLARGERLLAPRVRQSSTPQPRSNANADANANAKRLANSKERGNGPLKRETNTSQAPNNAATCSGSSPFANCCSNPATGGTSGTGCFFTFGSYNTQTW